MTKAKRQQTSAREKKEASAAEVKAVYPDKTIKIALYLWTNGIAPTPGKLIPKHCKLKGTVYILDNALHGLKQAHGTKFNSPADLVAAIREEAAKHQIVIHPSAAERVAAKRAARTTGASSEGPTKWTWKGQ